MLAKENAEPRAEISSGMPRIFTMFPALPLIILLKYARLVAISSDILIDDKLNFPQG